MIALETGIRYWLGLEERIANPLVTAVLRSPCNFLVSRRLLLLAYEGRRSGRYYETPVVYRERGDYILLVTPAAQTTWWRNFEDGHPASLLVRGVWRDGIGTVVTDDEAVTDHLRWLLTPIRRVSRWLVGRELPGESRLRSLGSRAVLVRVDLETQSDDQVEHGGLVGSLDR